MATEVSINRTVVDTHDFDERGYVEIFNADVTNAEPGSTARLYIGNNEAFNQDICGDCKMRFSAPYSFFLKKETFNINGELIITTPERKRYVYPFSSKVIGMNDIRISETGRQISMCIDPENPVLKDVLKDVAKRTCIRSWEPDDVLGEIWRAVADLGLHYSSVTGSVESGYQHANDVSDIIESRMFNCVDITLLFMTLFHMCGIRPVYIAEPNHALAGLLIKVNDKVLAKTRFRDYVIETEHAGHKVCILPLEGTAISHASLEGALMEGHDGITEGAEYKLTIPCLDRIPLMCRKESKVVF